METIELDPYVPRSDRVAQLAAAIQRGQIVATPTDTTWSLLCDPFDRRAVQRLQQIRLRMSSSEAHRKARESKPLSILASGLAQVGSYVLMDAAQFRLCRELSAGPVHAALLPASREVPRLLRSKRPHVGVRIPDHAICEALAEQVGNPLMTTTIRAEDGSLVSASPEVAKRLAGQLDVLVETEPIYPQESTVLDLTDGVPVVIREGAGPVQPEWDRADFSSLPG